MCEIAHPGAAFRSKILFMFRDRILCDRGLASTRACLLGALTFEPPVLLKALPSGCPIYIAAARVRPVRKDDDSLRFVSGWGGTPGEAVHRCEMEAAERFSAQFWGSEPTIRARAGQLPGSTTSITELLLISEVQYVRRRHWNHRYPGFNALPSRWRSNNRIDWTANTPHLSSAARWVPAGLCYLGHSRDREFGLPPADSNGVASGKTIEDAAARGFTELVERDAVAIWWYNRLIRPTLDRVDLGEPLVMAYADWASDRGRVLRLHDLSHDLGFCVVAAISHDISGGAISLGFGAALSSVEAARHAVGELAQFETNVALVEARIAAHGESDLTIEARALLSWWRSARLVDHPNFAGTGPIAPKSAHEPISLQSCLEICRQHSLEFLALDLTRASTGIPVVRVLVPGLRPKWARFAPGRLYEVPVQLGWRQSPAAPSELNSTPLMF
jgi:thiazole/oxazole-forming peptide maturase SagD family component